MPTRGRASIPVGLLLGAAAWLALFAPLFCGSPECLTDTDSVRCSAHCSNHVGLAFSDGGARFPNLLAGWTLTLTPPSAMAWLAIRLARGPRGPETSCGDCGERLTLSNKYRTWWCDNCARWFESPGRT